MIKNQKGITLTILAITVVIILILAAATINMSVGQGGMLFKSKETQELYENHVGVEDNEVNGLLTAVDEELKAEWQDETKANKPKLTNAMVPVKWDGNNWVVTDKKDSEWFDYSKKQWANVMLKDGMQVEGIADVSLVSLNEMKDKKVTKVGSMFVWIPRYAYQITTNYHTNSSTGGNINIEFLSGTTNMNVSGERFDWDNKNGQNSWNVHPAFEYNGAVTGIWVAKFEASHTGCTTDIATGQTSTDVTSLKMQVKPGITSWRNISIQKAYTVCANYNTSLNSHLIKNSEWGAIAYLAKSNYGKNSEIWINNSSSYITGSCGSSANSGPSVGVTTNYASSQGINASSTGNVYGVYDLNGGAWEQVASYVGNNNSNLTTNGSSLISGASYTKEVYGVGSDDSANNNYITAINKYGDAIYETSSGTWNTSGDNNKQAWYGETSYFSAGNKPFFYRGGEHNSSAGSGLFAFNSNTGAGSPNESFRPVLIVK